MTEKYCTFCGNKLGPLKAREKRYDPETGTQTMKKNIMVCPRANTGRNLWDQWTYSDPHDRTITEVSLA